MPATYQSLATTTLSVDTATVTFSNISGNYTDLVAVCSVKSTAGGFAVRINGSTSSIYSVTNLRGNGTAASSTRLTTSDLGGDGVYLQNGFVSTTEYTPVIWNFMNYSNTTTNKTVLVRASNSGNFVAATVGLVQTTSAITSLTFRFDGGGSLASGSVISLYGIKSV